MKTTIDPKDYKRVVSIKCFTTINDDKVTLGSKFEKKCRYSKLKKLLIERLQSFGCPDTYLDHTADSIVKQIKEIFGDDDECEKENKEEWKDECFDKY